MELTVDCLGQECPIPVVRTKQALSTFEEGVVETLVDNQTAVHNLENLAKTLKCTSEVDDRGDGTFAVKLTKDANSVQGAEVASAGTRVVVFSTDRMGIGDDTLGCNLMKAAIFALTQQDALPDTLLFYNGGVHLTCEGSECLEDLQKLADAAQTAVAKVVYVIHRAYAVSSAEHIVDGGENILMCNMLRDQLGDIAAYKALSLLLAVCRIEDFPESRIINKLRHARILFLFLSHRNPVLDRDHHG